MQETRPYSTEISCDDGHSVSTGENVISKSVCQHLVCLVPNKTCGNFLSLGNIRQVYIMGWNASIFQKSSEILTCQLLSFTNDLVLNLEICFFGRAVRFEDLDKRPAFRVDKIFIPLPKFRGVDVSSSSFKVVILNTLDKTQNILPSIWMWKPLGNLRSPQQSACRPIIFSISAPGGTDNRNPLLGCIRSKVFPSVPCFQSSSLMMMTHVAICETSSGNLPRLVPPNFWTIHSVDGSPGGVVKPFCTGCVPVKSPLLIVRPNERLNLLC